MLPQVNQQFLKNSELREREEKCNPINLYWKLFFSQTACGKCKSAQAEVLEKQKEGKSVGNPKSYSFRFKWLYWWNQGDVQVTVLLYPFIFSVSHTTCSNNSKLKCAYRKEDLKHLSINSNRLVANESINDQDRQSKIDFVINTPVVHITRNYDISLYHLVKSDTKKKKKRRKESLSG